MFGRYEKLRWHWASLPVLLLGLFLASSPSPVLAGHDQDEQDLIYFLPILPSRAKSLLDGGETVTFIDLRESEEFKRERLPGAQSIPLKELQARHNKVPKSGRVVLYCTCGVGNIEEAFAYQTLRNLGYRNVSVLEGGISEWRRLGYPIETDPRS
jgi:rhodanese-related sulfurtransferase